MKTVNILNIIFSNALIQEKSDFVLVVLLNQKLSKRAK